MYNTLENWKNKFFSFLALLRNITNDVIKKEAGGDVVKIS